MPLGHGELEYREFASIHGRGRRLATPLPGPSPGTIVLQDVPHALTTPDWLLLGLFSGSKSRIGP
jgi:hypothetical protein